MSKANILRLTSYFSVLLIAFLLYVSLQKMLDNGSVIWGVASFFMAAAILFFALPNNTQMRIGRAIPLWDLSVFRMIYFLILMGSSTMLAIYVPLSISLPILVAFVPAYTLCFLMPGYIYLPFQHIRQPNPEPSTLI